MSSKEENKLTEAAETFEKAIKPLIAFLTKATPIIIQACQKGYAIYIKLPLEAVRFIIGFVFCFFGGIYPTLFAAVQAAKHGGLNNVTKALGDLANETMVIIKESEKDDKKDEDGDGVADVGQIDGKALLLRKANLVATKINPVKVDEGIVCLTSVWVHVLATLSLQFARVVTLALTITDFIKKPIDRFVTPKVQSVVPKEYSRWVPVIIGWIAKSIAMSVAWTIQAIISAFTSALEGGLIMARVLLRYLSKKGISLNGMIPEKHEDTNLDEYLSYAFAATGFLFQLSIGFDITFPFNILLLPFEFAEYYMRWTITSSGD